MPTIKTNTQASLGGIAFDSTTSFTGTHISVIKGSYVISASSTTNIPIYAESDSDGDIKLIAFRSNFGLDVCRLRDKDNADVIDIKAAAVGSDNIVEDVSYILPGTASLPTVSNTDDVKYLQLSCIGSINTTCTIELAILFDAAAGDTIV